MGSRLVGLGMILVVAACGGVSEVDVSSQDADRTNDGASEEVAETDPPSTDSAPSTEAPPETSPETTTTTTTTTSTTTTTTTEPAPTGPSGSFDDPLPLGAPGVGFTYSDGLSDITWSGSVDALYPAAISQFNDDPGTCYVVVGHMTPTGDFSGAVNTSGFDTPDTSLIVGGQSLDSGAADCDSDEVEGAGYRWMLDAAVTDGTTYPFYDEFFVPEANSGTIERVVLGRPTSGDALYFTAPLSESLPLATPVAGPAVAESFEILPTADPVLSSFTYSDGFSDSEWEGTINGVVEVPVSSFSSASGRCLVVVGILTPTQTDDGAAISSGFDTPSLTAIADGRSIEDFESCDTDAVEAAGYQRRLDAEVTVGTRFPFYEEIFVEEGFERVEAIVLGNGATDAFLLFDPTVVAQIPAPS